MHTKFWLENLRGRDHFENLGTDRKIAEWISWKQGGKVAQNRDQWRALVNTILNLQVP
jgi:hypothetical protein